MKNIITLCACLLIINFNIQAQVNNSIDIKYQYNWNTISNAWNQQAKLEITYDSIGRMLNVKTFNFANRISADTNYYYNHSNQVIKKVVRNYDPIKDTFDNRLTHHYDSIGRKTLIEEHDWQFDSLKWKLISRRTYVYDFNNNLIENTFEKLDSNKLKILTSYKNDYQFNNNKLEKIINYWYNRNSQEYDTSYIISYNYINNFQFEVSKIDYLTIHGPAGNKDYKRVYISDSTFKVKNITFYFGNSLNEWTTSYMLDSISDIVVKDSNNIAISKIYSSVYKRWDDSLQTFVLDSKYEVDSNFNIPNFKSQTFYVFNGIKYDKLLYTTDTFDLYDNHIKYERFSYADGTKKLIDAERRLYNYTNGSKYYDMILQGYDNSEAKWYNNSREVISLFTSIDFTKNQEPEFIASPNPSNGNFELLFKKKITGKEKIVIYNIYGHLIQTHDLVFNTSRINISIDEKGIYFIRYKKFTQKIIIQ